MSTISNFDNFREEILNLFFDESIDWTTGVVGDYEKFDKSISMKKEFLTKYGENIIKSRYDIFRERVRTEHDLNQEKLIYDMVEELHLDYVMYCFIKEDSAKDKVNEKDYPMSFDEFQEKVIKFFKEANPSADNVEWLDWFLNEDNPGFMKTAYETACDDYDEAVAGENGVTPDKIFTDYYIKSNPVRVLEMF